MIMKLQKSIYSNFLEEIHINNTYFLCKMNLDKKEREDIFALFVRNHRLKFNEIEKQLDIRSNHLSYHLTKLIEDDILEKVDEYYILTKEAEKMIPFFAHITGKEQGPLSIIAAAIVNNNKICLLKRSKRPYKGYWSVIGGKLRLHESLQDTAIREAKEESGLDCKFDKLCSVLHERVLNSNTYTVALVIFFCKLTTDQINIKKEDDEGELAWFDLDNLPEKIIPSDKLMITELLNKDFSFVSLTMEDKDGELVSMKID